MIIRPEAVGHESLIRYFSLRDRVMVNTTWIDWPVDTQDFCFHVLGSVVQPCPRPTGPAFPVSPGIGGTANGWCKFASAPGMSVWAISMISMMLAAYTLGPKCSS